VRVRYRSELGSSTDGSFVFYDFTGGNWKGKVDLSSLKIIFNFPGTYRVWSQREDENPKPRLTRGAGKLEYSWRNWQAQNGFVSRFKRTLPAELWPVSEEKELTTEVDLSDQTFLLTAGDGSKLVASRAIADWPPAGVLREGRAFIQFRDLIEQMRENWERKQGHAIAPGVGMRERNGAFIAPFYGHGKEVVRVQPDVKTMEVGGQKIMLPSAPFVAGGVLYVPLDAMAKALGGTSKVNTKTKRFWFDVPV